MNMGPPKAESSRPGTTGELNFADEKKKNNPEF
jgi:hypothetical protein